MLLCVKSKWTILNTLKDGGGFVLAFLNISVYLYFYNVLFNTQDKAREREREKKIT